MKKAVLASISCLMMSTSAFAGIAWLAKRGPMSSIVTAGAFLDSQARRLSYGSGALTVGSGLCCVGLNVGGGPVTCLNKLMIQQAFASFGFCAGGATLGLSVLLLPTHAGNGLFPDLTADEAVLLGISEEERQIYLQQLDEINANIQSLHDSMPEDTAYEQAFEKSSLWFQEGLNSLHPATVKVMQIISENTIKDALDQNARYL